jgi:hypothetical protein
MWWLAVIWRIIVGQLSSGRSTRVRQSVPTALRNPSVGRFGALWTGLGNGWMTVPVVDVGGGRARLGCAAAGAGAGMPAFDTGGVGGMVRLAGRSVRSRGWRPSHASGADLIPGCD